MIHQLSQKTRKNVLGEITQQSGVESAMTTNGLALKAGMSENKNKSFSIKPSSKETDTTKNETVQTLLLTNLKRWLSGVIVGKGVFPHHGTGNTWCAKYMGVCTVAMNREVGL